MKSVRQKTEVIHLPKDGEQQGEQHSKMWHWCSATALRHQPLKVEDTIGLLDSSASLGRITVGTLMIELSYRKWVTSTDWNICLEGTVINGKRYKSGLTTDKLSIVRPSCDCYSRSAPVQVAPCGWVEVTVEIQLSVSPTVYLRFPHPLLW